LPNNDVVLRSDTTNEIFYPTVTPNGDLKLTESKVDINTGDIPRPAGAESGGGGGGAGGGGGRGGDAEGQAGGFYGEIDELDRQIADLERAVAEAENEAKVAQERQKFITSQRERLSDRLSGETRSAIDAEIALLISQYERAKDAAERGRTNIQGTKDTARSEELTGILGDTGGGGGDNTRGPSTGGPDTGGPGTGGPGTGGPGTGGPGSGGRGGGGGGGSGGGAGGGTGPSVGPDAGPDFGPEGDFTDTTNEPESESPRTPISTIVTLRTPEERFVRTVSPRITGEALAGILGAKKPLFGGDEDAQRAIWNRRSLRLRRALGL
jgi:hypothetical protein